MVSSRGLRRVVLKRTKTVLAELLPMEDAELFAATYNEIANESEAKVVAYRASSLRAAQ